MFLFHKEGLFLSTNCRCSQVGRKRQERYVDAKMPGLDVVHPANDFAG